MQKFIILLEKLGYNFLDEFRSTRNHFTFLANDGEQILIGAKYSILENSCTFLLFEIVPVNVFSRNAMYNLSSSTLAVENVWFVFVCYTLSAFFIWTFVQVFYWMSSTSDTEMCLMKGKSEVRTYVHTVGLMRRCHYCQTWFG